MSRVPILFNYFDLEPVIILMIQKASSNKLKMLMPVKRPRVPPEKPSLEVTDSEYTFPSVPPTQSPPETSPSLICWSHGCS